MGYERDKVWELVVNESGASIANWTSVAGTWSADAGGFLKQTGTGSSYSGLRYTAKTPGVVAMQAEIRIPSAGQPAGDHRALLAVGWDATLSTFHAPLGGIQTGATDRVWMQRGDQSTVGETYTIADDTWYTVLVLRNGVELSIFVDGVGAMSRFLAVADLEASEYVGLVSFQGIVHYRNIKAWRLSAPV